MKDRNVASRSALAAAGIILVLTAGLHGVGYVPLTRQLAASHLESFWLAGVKGLWLVFSLDLTIVGALLIAVAIAPLLAGRVVLAIAGLVHASETVMLLALVCVFVGTISLGIADLLVYVGVVLRRDAIPAQSGGT